MRKSLYTLSFALIVITMSCQSSPIDSSPEDLTVQGVTIARSEHDVKYTGLRSSSYGVAPFPHEEGWEHCFEEMQSFFPESQACGLWIIGNIEGSDCDLQFPQPEGTEDLEHITFYPYDKHEIYLNYFDQVGIQVFLQVESGMADMEQLIRLTLDKYGHHPSVAGFGVDLEWYDPQGQGGINGEDFFSPLDSETAMQWDTLIKSYNPEYRLFLKHWIWDETIMPQETTSDIIFISDSQGFAQYHEGDPQAGLDFMVEEFTNGWAANFRMNDNIRSVGYQIGYDSDRGIWQDYLAEPYPQNLSNAILQGIPEEQEVSFFWVDFTLEEVFLEDYQGPEPHIIQLPPIPIELEGYGENLAVGVETQCSSQEEDMAEFHGSRAVDNDLNTRWASYESDLEWLQLDLGTTTEISTLAIFWEYAHALEYEILLSQDGESWQVAHEESESDGELDLIELNREARYIRVNCLKRFTEWGNSIYEVAVYGKY